MKVVQQSFQISLTFALTLIVLASSTLTPAEPKDGARRFTRSMEFDYVGWTVDALALKLGQTALTAPHYLTDGQQKGLIQDYLKLVGEIEQVEYEIEKIYADPKISAKPGALAPWQEKLADQRAQRSQLGPLAEEVIQRQISEVLADYGLAVGGQPLPPVLYHITPLPYALIISPRDVIRQDNNISLDPDLTLDQMVELEKKVETLPNVSALVSPIGGVGVYPTMVMSTTDLPWLLDTVAHEWTHNYLTLRPLGVNYLTTGELRTMNETTANIVGGEVGKELLRRYYPEYLPKPEPTPAPTATPSVKPSPTPPGPTPTPLAPSFSFNKEMHTTRVTVDALLKDGKIDEAEVYMESRRKFFLDNGYLIRRLNQAYFAFHGAYADSPGGGAAGADPVGPAVQALRARSQSLAEFLNRIAWMTSFAELKAAVQ